MKDIHLTEEEQSEQFKQWWKENGVSIITGLVLGVAVILGVNYWRDYKQLQLEKASSVFNQILEQNNQSSNSSGQKISITKNVEHLKANYGQTPYAVKAALMLSVDYLNQGKTEPALENLSWALENANESSSKHIARINLARLSLDSGDYENAKNHIDKGRIEKGSIGYESMYQEITGDIATIEGDLELSESSYRIALESLPKGSTYGRILQYKIDQASGSKE